MLMNFTALTPEIVICCVFLFQERLNTRVVSAQMVRVPLILCQVILELLKISLNLKVRSSDILNSCRAYKSRGDSVFSYSV